MGKFHPDAALIDQLGGAAVVARKLGFPASGGVQRVQNWKYRGIPEIERLRNPALFKAPARHESEAPRDARETEAQPIAMTVRAIEDSYTGNGVEAFDSVDAIFEDALKDR